MRMERGYQETRRTIEQFRQCDERGIDPEDFFADLPAAREIAGRQYPNWITDEWQEPGDARLLTLEVNDDF